jgi:hypothetical protein
VLAAAIVEALDRAGRRVHHLDPPALIVGRHAMGAERAVALQPQEAAIVAAIDAPARAEGESVRPAAGRRHHALRAVGADAGDAAGGDLHQQDRAVGHRHRAFGEA